MQRKVVERELTAQGPRRRVGVGARRRSVTVNIAESPLTWLHAHGHLEDRLFDAGERLRADWERAQLGPSVTMRGSRCASAAATAGSIPRSDRSPRARFDGAIGAAGKGLSDILWRVVCAGETLPTAEKALAWPSRSGKLVLRLALERVADFYRLG